MYIKTTETDILPENGKDAEENVTVTFCGILPKGFAETGNFKVPKCGRINFKRHILPCLLPKGMKISKNATAKISVAADGKGNVCLNFCELKDSKSINARE